MAVRFAPFAKIKVFSLASFLYNNIQTPTSADANVDENVNNEDIVLGFLSDLQDVLNLETNKTVPLMQNIFQDVALATSVSITETYNTKAMYGIGEPENPVLVPGNVSVRISIARLTTDARQIADYITKPTFYYSAALQKLSTKYFASPTGSVGDLDFLFYTYFFIDSLEYESYGTPIGQLQNADIFAFMPNTYNKRIESNAADIVTDVEGEGKIFKLKDLIKQVNDAFAAKANENESGFTQSALPNGAQPQQ